MGATVVERKYFTCPSRESNPGCWIYRQTLYHVAVKAGFYRKAVEVYLYIPRPCDIKKLYLYILTFLKKSKYLNVLYPQHVYFDLSKIKDFKTHKQKNDGTSVIVERYIFIVCQIYRSNIYNHIKYIVWSIVCQRQYIIGFESLHMLDVDFCFIYLIKSKFN